MFSVSFKVEVIKTKHVARQFHPNVKLNALMISPLACACINFPSFCQFIFLAFFEFSDMAFNYTADENDRHPGQVVFL